MHAIQSTLILHVIINNKKRPLGWNIVKTDNYVTFMDMIDPMFSMGYEFYKFNKIFITVQDIVFLLEGKQSWTMNGRDLAFMS